MMKKFKLKYYTFCKLEILDKNNVNFITKISRHLQWIEKKMEAWIDLKQVIFKVL